MFRLFSVKQGGSERHPAPRLSPALTDYALLRPALGTHDHEP